MLEPQKTYIEVDGIDLEQFHASSQYPATQEFQPVIGDLHGNALKLLFFLEFHGVITYQNGAADKQRLVAIYKKPVDQLTERDIKRFGEILKNATFKKDIAPLRLVGDELADRGNNDYFTLKIFERLGQAGVPFEILFSNHGAEFLTYHESKKFGLIGGDSVDPTFSLQNLNKLQSQFSYLNDEVKIIVENFYKPNIQLIFYNINDDEDIFIGSHAPIPFRLIEQLANELGILYRDKDAFQLAETIDEINYKFQKEYVRKNQSRTFDCNEFLQKLIWNQNYPDDHAANGRPHHHNGYKIYYFNGHCLPRVKNGEKLYEHTFSLDNHFGNASSQAKFELNSELAPEERSSLSKQLVQYNFLNLPIKYRLGYWYRIRDDRYKLSFSQNNIGCNSNQASTLKLLINNIPLPNLLRSQIIFDKTMQGIFDININCGLGVVNALSKMYFEKLSNRIQLDEKLANEIWRNYTREFLYRLRNHDLSSKSLSEMIATAEVSAEKILNHYVELHELSKKLKKLQTECESYQSHLRRSPKINDEKIQKMGQLLGQLNPEEADSEYYFDDQIKHKKRQIRNFKTCFDGDGFKQILSGRRDASGVHFLKKIGLMLGTFGLALRDKRFSFFKSHGSKAVERIEYCLKKTYSVKRN